FAGVGLVALLALATNVALAMRAPAACRDHLERRSRVWGSSRKEAVKGAFDRSSLRFARQSWEHVERALDRYAEGWSRQYAGACEGTRSTSDSLGGFLPVAECLD